jgi:hypothetical protein
MDVISIIALVQVIVFAVIILLTLVYSIPLLIFRRFHHRTHVFTINVCVAILCCSIYWVVSLAMTEINVRQFYNIQTYSLVFYAQTMCTLQVPMALIVVSIHQLCCVVFYSKAIFKTKRWAFFCVTCQWIFGSIISLPVVIRNRTVRISMSCNIEKLICIPIYWFLQILVRVNLLLI